MLAILRDRIIEACLVLWPTSIPSKENLSYIVIAMSKALGYQGNTIMLIDDVKAALRDRNVRSKT